MSESRALPQRVSMIGYFKRYYKNMKISNKLAFSYSIIAAVFIIILGVWYYVNTAGYVRSKTIEMLNQTIRQVKDNTEYKINLYNSLSNTIYTNANLQNLLYDIYTHPADKLFPQRSILEYIQPLKSSYTDIETLSLIVNNHTIPLYGNVIQSERSIKDQDWYRTYIDSGEGIFWMDDMSGNLILVRKLDHLIYDSYLGLLKIEIKSDTFFKGLKDAGSAEQGWVDITDKSGNILYSSLSLKNQEDAELAQRTYALDLFENPTSETVRFNERDYMVSSDDIEFTDWHIVFLVPMQEYDQAVNGLKFTTMIIIVLCVMIFIWVSWFLASHLTEKIRELSGSMEKIQTGDFNVHIAYSSGDELGNLITGFNVMAGKLQKMVDEICSIELREKQHELQILQAQINPHFLYNTLASISWLGTRIGSESIIQISNSLARFYRLSLSKGKNIIHIKDEVEHVNAYISIQNLRYNNKIKISYEIDENILEADTPKLILQPFVENALVHGMSRNKNTITIRIVIKPFQDEIIWKIIDDGVGISDERLQQMLNHEATFSDAGYGVNNVNQRLKLYFGDHYGIRVESKLGMGTTVTIRTPGKYQKINNNFKEI